MSTEATQGMGADVADLESMFDDGADETVAEVKTQNQPQAGTQTQQVNEDELVLDENGDPVDPAIANVEDANVEVELDENGDPVVDVDPNAPPVVLEIPDDHIVKMVIDGKEVERKYGDLVAGAQKAEAAERRFEEAAAIRKEYTEKAQTIGTREQQLGQVLQHYITQSQQLLQAQEPKWAELLASDPTEYVRQRHNWEIKTTELNQARQIQQNVERMQADERAASELQRLQEEKQKLPKVIPEWSDPKKAAEGAMELDKYLATAGIKVEMRKAIDSVEVLAIARKAMLYDRAIAKQKASRVAGNSTGQVATKVVQGQAVQQRQPVRQQARVERPGAGTQAQTQASRQNLSKANASKAFNANPSVDTLAGFFE